MFEMIVGKLIVSGIDYLINSTSNKTDDKILDVTKKAVVYLAPLANNSVDKTMSDVFKDMTIRNTQG